MPGQPATIMITVEPGMSLWSLAVKYLGNGLSWPVLYQLNPQLDPDPNLIIAGRQLRVPVVRKEARPDISVIIAAALLTAVSADVAFQVARRQIQIASIPLAGIDLQALRGALSAVFSFPPQRTEGFGAASAATDRINLMRRAQFVVSAAKRITADMKLAQSEGKSVSRALAFSIGKEKRFYGQHLDAIYQRTMAAAKVDGAADEYGDLLGWYTVHDGKTSPECKAADQHNFYASAMPMIGYPGGVHPHCRCYPGPPYAGAQILPSARTRVAA